VDEEKWRTARTKATASKEPELDDKAFDFRGMEKKEKRPPVVEEKKAQNRPVEADGWRTEKQRVLAGKKRPLFGKVIYLYSIIM